MQPSAHPDEVELLWLGPQSDADAFAEELEISAAGWQAAASEAASELAAAPVEEEADDQLTRIAEDQGWDPAEVEAMRIFLNDQDPSTDEPTDAGERGQASAPNPVAASEWPKEDAHPSWQLPGAAELEDALAALRPPEARAEGDEQRAEATDRGWPDRHSGRVAFRGGGLAREWSKPEVAAPRVSGAPQETGTAADKESAAGEAEETDASADEPQNAEAGKTQPQAGPATVDETQETSAAEAVPETSREPGEHQPQQHGVPEPEWLRGRRDPAARAYRRLRRIFPS
jgi:hypothetical protein